MITNNKKSNIGKGKENLDWKSILVFFSLMIIGWMTIYAAVYDESGLSEFSFNTRYGSQLIWIMICVITAVVIMFIDNIVYHIIAYPTYLAMLLILLLTIFVGSEINGARSWIKIGGFTMQPAEFAKIATALVLARYMSSYNFSLHNKKNIFTVALIIGVPIILILLQNDTGSAIIFLAFFMVLFREGLNSWLYIAFGLIILIFVFSFLLTPAALLAATIILCTLIEGVINKQWKNNIVYLAGVALFSVFIYLIANLLFRYNFSFFYSLLTVSILSIAVVVLYAYANKLKKAMIPVYLFIGSLLFIGTIDYVFDNILQVHQQKRILNLLGVENDLQNWGYNINQSKIAIGSGGLTGKGFLQGTQTRYDFVPEQSTDFIFCTIGEERGFIGSLIILALFCTLILRLIIMGERQEETFGRVYCYGVASLFFLHILINIGMTIGLVPVIGIPLPLFSYGGSSLLAFTILFFIAIKMDSKRRETGKIFNN